MEGYKSIYTALTSNKHESGEFDLRDIGGKYTCEDKLAERVTY